MKKLITEQLGLYGWKNLEPVILAALATEKPLLLLGKHGSAKSFILERISEALKLNYRFYNASLINYDDLVGIPIPSKDKKSLEYISNSTSIWDAEVVFIDEINRTKPELQNKLFPIIYDKRVQGIDLKKLKYRFAAMNPAYVDDEDDENENEVSYFGAMPLDPALVDRFPFIINVPEWDDLNRTDQINMLMDTFNGKHEFEVSIDELINRCKKNYEICKNKLLEKLTTYIVALVNLLEESFGYISSRRASMFIETLIAIHAVRITLSEFDKKSGESKDEIGLKDSLYLHIVNTLPFKASKKISDAKLLAIANEAWTYIGVDDIKMKLISIKDSREKIIYLINNKKKLNTIDLSNELLNSLSKLSKKERRAMSLISYLNLRDVNDLPATTIETLSSEIVKCFNTQIVSIKATPDKARIGRKITELTYNQKNVYHNNLLNSFSPDDYSDVNDVTKLSKYFLTAWESVKYDNAA